MATTARRRRYGRGGDFLTAPTASPWYATVLAGFLDRLAARVGPLAVCDVASGDGALLAELAAALARRDAAAVGHLASVERSPAMRSVQSPVDTSTITQFESVSGRSMSRSGFLAEIRVNSIVKVKAKLNGSAVRWGEAELED